jgi:transposase-like protein
VTEERLIVDVSPSPSRRKKALRPDPCRVCGSPSWWDGGRRVAEVIQELGQGVRRVIDVLRPRARCSDRRCAAGSWTLYAADAYPHRSYQLAVVASAVAEVCVGGASRQTAAGHHACSRRSVARWVRWTAQLAQPANLAQVCARLDPDGLPPPPPAPAGSEVSRAGAVLQLLDHLAEVLRRRGSTLPGRGPGLPRLLAAQRARFGDVAWLTRSSPPLRVAWEALPV